MISETRPFEPVCTSLAGARSGRVRAIWPASGGACRYHPLPLEDDELSSSEEDLLPERKQSAPSKEQAKDEDTGYSVVAMLGLGHEQRRKFAAARGVTDLDEFERQLVLNNLGEMSERPGDLDLLVREWRLNSKFGSLLSMMEASVWERLREHDPHRRSYVALTDERARAGAERLAAALTLGRSFTIRVQNPATEQSVTERSIDPARALPDWTPSEREELLSRGLFVPATYGLIRFHHRSAQEYLTAYWFKRLFENERGEQAVSRLLFTSSYDVDTVPPSLRPAAAWLAQWRPSVREGVLKREPLALLKNGDPRSLSVDVRTRLLDGLCEEAGCW